MEGEGEVHENSLKNLNSYVFYKLLLASDIFSLALLFDILLEGELQLLIDRSI